MPNPEAPGGALTGAPEKPSALAGPFEVWADGACSGNPGPGGWAAVLRNPTGKEKELTGAEAETTNNRMELTAAIRALSFLSSPSVVTLHTDSQYVQRGMSEWLPGWLRKGWKNSQGKAVVNRDLWEELMEAARRHEVTWQWVRGHAGDTMNERVDGLAVAVRKAKFGR